MAACKNDCRVFLCSFVESKNVCTSLVALGPCRPWGYGPSHLLLAKSSFIAVPLRLTFIRLQTTNFFVGAGPLTMDSILAGSCLNPQVSRTDHVDKHVEAFSRNQRNCLHSIYLNRSICLATGLPQTKKTLVFMPDFGLWTWFSFIRA